MKKFLIALTLFFISSCSLEMRKEAQKSAKADAASNRINRSEENSQKTFKELDE